MQIAGYLYFHKAPNKEEFHAENCRKAQMFRKLDVFGTA